MSVPIIDIHCDLLSYLTEKKEHSVDDRPCRCSYSDLRQGGVCVQTLAIFTPTQPGSAREGRRQVDAFLHLIQQDPLRFKKYDPALPLDKSSPIQVIPALENASCFAEEGEPFDQSIKRLESYERAIGPIFYISLTWNEENRFGGGNNTQIGLKEDGKRLLEWMDGKRIAIDLSHTSDRLAYDLFEWIDKQSLDIPLLASHSNFRALSPYPRNLPDEIAKEIIRRNGLIGLNFFAPFVHQTDPSVLARHVEYGLSLGAQDVLAFGADFFYEQGSLATLKQKYQREQLFYAELANASVYPAVLTLCAQKIGLTTEHAHKIASGNAQRFLHRLTSL